MDHDAVSKEVQGLKKFRTEAEEAIAFYKGMKAAGAFPAPPTTPALSEEDKQRISSIDDIAAKIEALQHFRVDVSGAIEAVGGIQVLAVLKGMAEWFAANRDGLEILLSLDGDPDKEDISAEEAKAPLSSATDTASQTEQPAPVPTTEAVAESAAEPAPEISSEQPAT